VKSQAKTFAGALALVLIGAAVPVALVWNPGHWSWADAFTRRLQASTPQSPSTASTAPANAPKQRKIKYWRAPMNPNYISDKPGKSPMGMDLIPVYEDEQPQETGIRVDPNFLQNFAVRTAKAETGSIPVDIRTVGLLNYNDKDLAFINTKFEGWIEKAAVNYIGEPVTKGQVLFEIYSPQLVTTEQEYLSALEYVRKLAGRADPDAVARAFVAQRHTRAVALLGYLRLADRRVRAQWKDRANAADSVAGHRYRRRQNERLS